MIGKILTLLLIPVTLAFVFGTALIEFHTMKQLFPYVGIAFLINICIAISKILVTFLYRRYNRELSENSRGIAIFSIGLMFLFAISMASVTINSSLYRTNANKAYENIKTNKKEELDEKLNSRLEYINSQVKFYSDKLDKERGIVVNGVYKGIHYREYDEKLKEYEKQKQDITDEEIEKYNKTLSKVDTRMTEMDNKNKVFASFVYAIQDISDGDRYGLAIFIFALIISITLETLTITMSNYMGIIYKIY